MVSVVFLTGCSSDQDAFPEDEPKTSLTQEQEAAILKMVDYVMGDSSKKKSLWEHELGIYYDAIGYCLYDVKGNCLPEITVSPGLNITRPDLEFDKTKIGQILEQHVKNGNLELKVDMNDDTKTTFRVYSNPTNQDRNMVVPIK